MGMAIPVYYSAEMVRALPDDGRRHETVHGELLVTPSPSLWHQELIDRLRDRIKPFIKQHGIGHLVSSPADISWAPDILVQPDLFVVPMHEARKLEWAAIRTLILTVEVLSPSTERYDRFTKRRLYQEAGVPTYWIVDGDRRFVEIWTPAARFPELRRDRITWQPVGTEASLEIDLEDLFAPL